MGISILFTFLGLAGCNSALEKTCQRSSTVLSDNTVPVSIVLNSEIRTKVNICRPD